MALTAAWFEAEDAALRSFGEIWRTRLREMQEQEMDEFLRVKEHDPGVPEAQAEPTFAPAKDSAEANPAGTEAPAQVEEATREAVPAKEEEVSQEDGRLAEATTQVQAKEEEESKPEEAKKEESRPEEATQDEKPDAKTDEGQQPEAKEEVKPEEAQPEVKPAEPTEESKPEVKEEAQEKQPMDPEAVRAAAQKAADVLSKLLTKPLEYEVRERHPLHAVPDAASKEVATLSPGERLSGYPGGGWLRLQNGRGWAHIGRNLALCCLQPTVRARYLEALDVCWPGFGKTLQPNVKVVYIVEWRCRQTGAAGHAVCHKVQEVVSDLPQGRSLELHVAVRLRAPLAVGVDSPPEVRFGGPWLEVQTLNPDQGEDDEDAEGCMDPFGTARGGCLDCHCYGFFWRPGLEEKEESDQETTQVGMNADPNSIKCIRCGDPFGSHTRAGTAAADKLLESRPARTFIVSYQRVFVRAKRSTKGDALGALRQGTEVSGCCEGRWLRLTRDTAREVNVMPKSDTRAAKSKFVDAWVLMDGTHLGLATLLVPEELASPELREQLQKEEEAKQRKAKEAARKAEEKRKPKAKAKAGGSTAEPDSEDELGAVRIDPLQGLMEAIYTKPADFLVLKGQLPVHRRPSTSSRTVAQLKRGQMVSGWLQEKWLLLAEGAKTPTSSKGGWVLVDASSLNLGEQLQPQHPVPKEIRAFSYAVVLDWEKFPAKHVEYQVEWAEEAEKEKITIVTARETMCMARVHELPSETLLRFRITAKVFTAPPDRGGELFAECQGPWEEAETGATIEKLEEGNLCVDPLANLRGRCMDCSCHGFVLAEYGERPRTGDTLEEVSCRRCSCSCVRHFIVGEFHYRNPGAKKKPEPASKPPPGAAPSQPALPAPEPRPTTWKVEDGEGIQFVLDKVGEALNLYETLGVPGNSEKAQIRAAYRQVSLSIHPDKVGHLNDPDLRQQAENAFKVVSSAYEILSDDPKRAEYDRKLRLTGATFGSRGGGRFNLTSIAFLKKFLSKERGGFGWDLSAKPPGDWEEQAPGVYVRGKAKEGE
ncbi:unnamed protein product [Effrenium voratum]|nr:unnamed protein product [Effrenium voratum]